MILMVGFLLGGIYTLKAQKRTNQMTKQYQKLHAEYDQALKDWLPQKALAIAKKYLALAEKNKEVAEILEGNRLLYLPSNPTRIENPLEEEERYLRTLLSQPWVKGLDRRIVLLKLEQLLGRIYTFGHHNWEEEAGIKQNEIKKMLLEMLSEPQTLLSEGKDLVAIYARGWQNQPDWRELTSLEQIIMMTVKEDQGMIYESEEFREFLSQLVTNALVLLDQSGKTSYLLQSLLIELISPEQQKERQKLYRQLLKEIPSSYPYRASIAIQAIENNAYSDNDEKYQLITSLQQGLSPQEQALKERLKNFKDELSYSLLNASMPDYLIAQDTLFIPITYKAIREVTAKIYRVPDTLLNAPKGLTHLVLTDSLPYPMEASINHPTPEPETLNLRQDTLELRLPKNGRYLIALIGKPNALSPSKERMHTQFVQRTDVYALRLRLDDEAYVQLLSARDGAPIAGNVAWYKERRDGVFGLGPLQKEAKLSKLGLALWGGEWLQLQHDADPLLTYYSKPTTSYLWAGADRPNDHKSLAFWGMTDRAVYQQGDTLHLVGRLAEISDYREEARPYEGAELEISLNRGEGNNVKQTVKTDSYGSYSLSIPLEDSYIGQHRIEIKEKLTERQYSVTFEVADYKKASAELLLELPKESPRLNQSLTISGKAKYLSGEGIDGLKLNYTLRRMGSFYRWYPWFYKFWNEETISGGSLETSKDGSYSLPLLFTPVNKELKEESLQSFYMYTLNIDGVLPNGETISASHRWFIGTAPARYKLKTLGAALSTRRSIPITLETTDFYEATTDNNQKILTLSNEQGKTLVVAFSDKKEFSLALPKGLRSGCYTLKLYNNPDRRSHKEFDYNTTALSQEQIWIINPKEKQLSLSKEEGLILTAERDSYSFGDDLPEIYFATAFEGTPLFYLLKSENGVEEYRLLHPQKGLNRRALKLKSKGKTPNKLEVELYFVHTGKLYKRKLLFSRRAVKPKMTLRWESFRDRILSDSKERLSCQILVDGRPVEARVSAWLYDAAIDLIRENQIPQYNLVLERSISSSLLNPLYEGGLRRMMRSGMPLAAMSLKEANASDLIVAEFAPGEGSKLSLRKDFRDTAFFLPELESDSSGKLSWEFNVPSSLSRWRLVMAINDKKMNWLTEERYIESYKPFAITLNAPRFIREGDTAYVLTNLRNYTSQPLEGTVILEIFDPQTGKILNSAERSFSLKKEETSLGESFPIAYQHGLSEVGLRIRATAGDFRDGEQHQIPQIARKVLAVNTLARELRGMGDFIITPSLFQVGEVEEGLLSFKLSASPIAYALSAMPSLIETNDKSALSIASALKASRILSQLLEKESIRKQILKGDLLFEVPKEALQKGPWAKRYRELQESNKQLQKQAKEGDNKAKKIYTLASKLEALQNKDGGFSWFEGMQSNLYVTLRTTLLLGADLLNEECTSKLVRYIKEAIHQRAKSLKEKKDGDLRYTDLLLAEGVEQVLSHIEEGDRAIVEGELKLLFGHIAEHYREIAIIDRPMAALLLKKEHPKLSRLLLRSAEEHFLWDDHGKLTISKYGDPLGWHSRSFDVLLSLGRAILDLTPEDKALLWNAQQTILSERRVSGWASDLQTLQAIELLLLDNEAILTEESNPTARLLHGKSKLEGDGTSGSYEITKGDLPTIGIEGLSPKGQAWLAATLSYPTEADRLPAFGKELELERHLFIHKRGAAPEQLIPLEEGQLSVGDELVTELLLRASKDFDYIVIEDPRLGAAEMIYALPYYKYNDSCSYREEPHNSFTRFYFEHIRKGEQRLRYRQRIDKPGIYQLPGASAYSALAPSYSSRSSVDRDIQVGTN